MGKAGIVAFGGSGSVVLAAAATSPEVAISNLAGWASLVGADRLASALPKEADMWGIYLGIALLIAAGLLCLRYLMSRNKERIPLGEALQMLRGAAKEAKLPGAQGISSDDVADLKRYLPDLGRMVPIYEESGNRVVPGPELMAIRGFYVTKSDLIPLLATIVKNAAQHAEDTLGGGIANRSGAHGFVEDCTFSEFSGPAITNEGNLRVTRSDFRGLGKRSSDD